MCPWTLRSISIHSLFVRALSFLLNSLLLHLAIDFHLFSQFHFAFLILFRFRIPACPILLSHKPCIFYNSPRIVLLFYLNRPSVQHSGQGWVLPIEPLKVKPLPCKAETASSSKYRALSFACRSLLNIINSLLLS